MSVNYNDDLSKKAEKPSKWKVNGLNKTNHIY